MYGGIPTSRTSTRIASTPTTLSATAAVDRVSAFTLTPSECTLTLGIATLARAVTSAGGNSTLVGGKTTFALIGSRWISPTTARISIVFWTGAAVGTGGAEPGGSPFRIGAGMISGYRAMWVFVLFDLPVKSAEDRRVAARFRKDLLADGFWMIQYSIYARPCPTEENAEVHVGRVRALVPSRGHVRILRLTDKQFGRMEVYVGKISRKPESIPDQLEIF